MFKAAYDSAWHQPGVAWMAALLLSVLVLSKARGSKPAPLYGYFLVFAVEIALDAYFSGPFAPKALASMPAMATAVSVVFVILGDYRYFVLVEEAASGELDTSAFGKRSAWLRAVPYAFAVPIASTIVRELFPAPFVDERKTYLLYELMFLALAVTLRALVLPKRLANRDGGASLAPTQSWVLVLTAFEILQYGLWAGADLILLAGHVEPGYLLRLVPNVLYYGVFLLFAWRTVPVRERGPNRLDARDAAPV